jgi:hypothetical protein
MHEMYVRDQSKFNKFYVFKENVFHRRGKKIINDVSKSMKNSAIFHVKDHS